MNPIEHNSDKDKSNNNMIKNRANGAVSGQWDPRAQLCSLGEQLTEIAKKLESQGDDEHSSELLTISKRVTQIMDASGSEQKSQQKFDQKADQNSGQAGYADFDKKAATSRSKSPQDN
jgi:hypothetical protein